MRRNPRAFAPAFATATAALLAALPVAGHHSVAMYDTDHLTTLTGVVTRIEWTSPHVFVFFVVAGDYSESAEWSMELDPPVLMRRYGWTRDTVEVGDEIVVTGAPAKSGAPVMRGALVELADGTQLRVWSRV